MERHQNGNKQGRYNMKKTFILECTVEVEIDESRFDDLLKDFRECIKSTATIDTIFRQVAYNEANGGGFCEGVGENGKDFKAGITELEITEELEGD